MQTWFLFIIPFEEASLCQYLKETEYKFRQTENLFHHGYNTFSNYFFKSHIKHLEGRNEYNFYFPIKLQRRFKILNIYNSSNLMVLLVCSN